VCEWDASTWIDFWSLILNAATLVLAGFGLFYWKAQLRGSSKHAVAIEVATEARTLEVLFFEARSRMYFGSEFKEGIPPREQTHDDEYSAVWEHVYQNRWAFLHPQITTLARLSAKAGAVLGDEVASKMTDLSRLARSLSDWMSRDLEQKRTPPDVIRQWTDQAFVASVSAYVTASDTKDDKFSKSFLEKLQALLDALKPHL
jgi:hypothetical protein